MQTLMWTSSFENGICSIPTSTQQRTTNGPPAKRHLMAYRWRAVGGPPLCASWDMRLLFLNHTCIAIVWR